MKNKLCKAMCVLAVLTMLTGCASEEQTVPVQRVDSLMQAAAAPDCYAGVVVTENVTKVARDDSMKIKELLVAEGEPVVAGQTLFSYDVEQLQLELDKQQLELERLNRTKTNLATELKNLQEQLKKLDKDADKVPVNLEISRVKNEQLQNEYDIKAKQVEIDHIKQSMQNVQVTSPVNGTVRKINQDGSADEYMLIQKVGNYRVKGAYNELSANGGITLGASVEVISRLDETQVWTGVVSLIENEEGKENSSNGYWGGDSLIGSLTSTTSYPFYIDLEDSQGLLLGQHVYIRLAVDADMELGLCVPESYLVNLNTNEETGVTTAQVWLAGEEDKLVLQTVELGGYYEDLRAYDVFSGLNGTDFIAAPSAEGCREGASVSYRTESDFTG